MKRRLIVMRHAKADRPEEIVDDHARPLKKRGWRDAPLVAARLNELGWIPDVTLSSDSLRTRQTFEAMQKVWGPEAEVRYFAALYAAGSETLREVLAQAPDEVGCILALGHNPGWEEAVDCLAGEEVVLPTSAAALLEGAGPSWSAAVARRGSWKLCDLIRPKELADE